MWSLGKRKPVTISLVSLGIALVFYIFSATMILSRPNSQCVCPSAGCPKLDKPEDHLINLTLNMSPFSSNLGVKNGSVQRSEVTQVITNSLTKITSVPKSSEPPLKTIKPTPKPTQKSAPKLTLPPEESLVEPPPPVQNPSSCSSFPQYLAIYVHSGPANAFRRNLIRQTWGSPDVLKRLNATVNFILGKPMQPSLIETLARENQSYGDIVQGSFIDTYRNISLKALMGLEWVSKHCQRVRYLLKSDDDIFVDTFALVRHLMSSLDTQPEKPKGVLYCNYWNSLKSRMPVRKRSKWIVSYAEYNKTEFPGFCQGAAYVLSPDAAFALHQQSTRVPRLWLDDVYITGLLREAANITATGMNKFYRDGKRSKFDDLIKHITSGSPLFVHGLGVAQFKDLWKHVVKMERIHQLQFR